MRRIRIREKVSLRVLLLALTAGALMLTACDPTQVPAPTPTWHELDPVFRKFYEHMGGQDALGEILSNAFIENDRIVGFDLRSPGQSECNSVPTNNQR